MRDLENVSVHGCNVCQQGYQWEMHVSGHRIQYIVDKASQEMLMDHYIQ